MSQETTILRCKVVLLGDSKVGKTALSAVYREGESKFPKNYSMTPGMEVNQRVVRLPETNTSVELYIFDTSGLEVYDDVVEHVLQDVNFLMVGYNIADAKTFTNCTRWIEKATSKRSSHENQLAGSLIALQSDLAEHIAVTQEEAQRLADIHGFSFFECSAYGGDSVDEPFTHAAEHFYGEYQKACKAMHELVN